LQNFKVGPTQKAEIIRQFAARVVTGHSISSDVITELVNDQTKASLSSRTIRWHMNKFGLTSIKNTLPELVKELKKLLTLLVDAQIHITQPMQNSKEYSGTGDLCHTIDGQECFSNIFFVGSYDRESLLLESNHCFEQFGYKKYSYL